VGQKVLLGPLKLEVKEVSHRRIGLVIVEVVGKALLEEFERKRAQAESKNSVE
jgi:hypothetical protein